MQFLGCSKCFAMQLLGWLLGKLPLETHIPKFYCTLDTREIEERRAILKAGYQGIIFDVLIRARL